MERNEMGYEVSYGELTACANKLAAAAGDLDPAKQQLADAGIGWFEFGPIFSMAHSSYEHLLQFHQQNVASAIAVLNQASKSLDLIVTNYKETDDRNTIQTH
jgi:uncharacterized protein YukE